MAPGLGLAHTDPTSYHESKKKSLHQNGDDASTTQQKSTQVPAVPVLQNDCQVEDVVEALKVCDIYIYLSSSIIHEKHPGLTLPPSYCWGDGYDARLLEVVSLKTPLLMNISIKLKVCITQPSHPLPNTKKKKRKKEKKRKHLH